MTPLERGLARSARREGKTIEYIAEALCRGETTIKRAIKSASFAL